MARPLRSWRAAALVSALGAVGCSSNDDGGAQGSGGQAGAAGSGVAGAAGSAGSGGAATAGAGGSDPGFVDPLNHPNWGPELCPPVADGTTVGTKSYEYLEDVVVKSCDGEPVSLRQFCGSTTFWLFAAHGWCPHCRKTSSFAESIQSDHADAGLATAIVLVESSSSTPPTPADCASWADVYGLKGVAMLYDDTGAVNKLYDQGYTALSMFVDRNYVVRNKLHTDNEAQIRGELAALLGL